MYEAWGYGAWGQNGAWGQFGEPAPVVHIHVPARPPGISNRQAQPVYLVRPRTYAPVMLPRRQGVSIRNG